MLREMSEDGAVPERRDKISWQSVHAVNCAMYSTLVRQKHSWASRNPKPTTQSTAQLVDSCWASASPVNQGPWRMYSWQIVKNSSRSRALRRTASGLIQHTAREMEIVCGMPGLTAAQL